MPPGRKKHADTFLQTKSLKFLILSVLIGMSVFLNACTGEKKEQLDEKLTESAPVVSPMLSTDSQITSGNDFFLKGQFEDAIKYYEDGIAKNRSVAFYNIGVSYYLMGDIKKSEEAFRNSVAEDPGFREAYMNLAVVLTQTGQLAEAEKYVEKLLADESSSKLLVNMANIHLKKGETAKAAQ
jgi:tetratricopeptide (TPR) repeat protein